MEFPAGQTVKRQRRRTAPDPYNPARTVPTDWSDPDEVVLPNAFVASTSSSATSSAVRSQVVTTKSLYLGTPGADVQPGDRIVVGADKYQVEVKPAADTNPFTGWTPVQEIPLKEVSG